MGTKFGTVDEHGSSWSWCDCITGDGDDPFRKTRLRFTKEYDEISPLRRYGFVSSQVGDDSVALAHRGTHGIRVQHEGVEFRGDIKRMKERNQSEADDRREE